MGFFFCIKRSLCWVVVVLWSSQSSLGCSEQKRKTKSEIKKISISSSQCDCAFHDINLLFCSLCFFTTEVVEGKERKKEPPLIIPYDNGRIRIAMVYNRILKERKERSSPSRTWYAGAHNVSIQKLKVITCKLGAAKNLVSVQVISIELFPPYKKCF